LLGGLSFLSLTLNLHFGGNIPYHLQKNMAVRTFHRFYQSINQSINQAINQSINQSIDRSIRRSVDQSIDQVINQSINQSSIHCCSRAECYFSFCSRNHVSKLLEVKSKFTRRIKIQYFFIHASLPEPTYVF
jgi:hypothetical protein